MPALIHHRYIIVGQTPWGLLPYQLTQEICAHLIVGIFNLLTSPQKYSNFLFQGGCIFIFPGYGIVIMRKLQLSQQQQ